MRVKLRRILATGVAALALAGATALAPAPAAASDAGVQGTTCAISQTIGGTDYGVKCVSNWPWENFHYQAWAWCEEYPGGPPIFIEGDVGESYWEPLWSEVDCWPILKRKAGHYKW